MRTVFRPLVLALVSLAVASTTQAQIRGKPGQALGDNPNPVIWGAPRPAPPPQKPTPKPDASQNRPQNSCGCCPLYGSSLYYPGFGYVYLTNPYSYAYSSAYYAPTENIYGPAAAQRFIGGDRFAPASKIADDTDLNDVMPRGSNAQSTALAGRFITFGDAQFAKRNFVEANNRYRTAARTAPQLADAWFRQGLALAAMGRFPQAADAIKHGLRIDPDWPNSDFTLDTLFEKTKPDQKAKESVLDALVAAANDKPHDADVLFMTGVFFHFDGQAKRAKTYFDRARQWVGKDAPSIKPFLANKP
jgi:tetratricopeptide (TPR) repeat protein